MAPSSRNRGSGNSTSGAGSCPESERESLRAGCSVRLPFSEVTNAGNRSFYLPKAASLQMDVPRGAQEPVSPSAGQANPRLEDGVLERFLPVPRSGSPRRSGLHQRPDALPPAELSERALRGDP